MLEDETQPTPSKSTTRVFGCVSLILGLGTIVAVSVLITRTSIHAIIDPEALTCPANSPPSPPPSMFPELRRKLIAELSPSPGTFVFMAGGLEQERDLADTEILFRQDSNFLYVTGYPSPGAMVLIDAVSSHCSLFVEYVKPSDQVWNGASPSLEQLKTDYAVDSIYYTANFSSIFDELKPSTVLVLPNQQLPVPVGDIVVDNSTLLPALYNARATKTEDELTLIRLANVVSSHAHIQVIRQTQIGGWEYKSAASFEDACYQCGLRFQAYVPIVAAGANSAFLHYTADDQELRHGQLLLIDAGAEAAGYASDITRTWPVNGGFTSDQRDVYNAVLGTQTASLAMYRPGGNYTDIQHATSRAMLRELLDIALVYGDVDALYNASIHRLFQPHGLGHLVGLDVHDTSTYPDQLEPPRLLEPNMVMTCEPGIYFNPLIFEPAFEDAETRAFLNVPRIQELYALGGVRIEDDVLITADGHELLSVLPSSVTAIEALVGTGLYGSDSAVFAVALLAAAVFVAFLIMFVLFHKRYFVKRTSVQLSVLPRGSYGSLHE